MRIEFVAFCEKCEEEYLSSRPLPLVIEKMDCGICEEKGTSKIIEITKAKLLSKEEKK